MIDGILRVLDGAAFCQTRILHIGGRRAFPGVRKSTLRDGPGAR
jgi:hypothetical protein